MSVPRLEWQADAIPGRVTDTVAWAPLVLATVIVLGLLARTSFGIARGEIRTLGG